MSSPRQQIAIIGAGLGGLTLALSLHQQGFCVRLCELRPKDYPFGGAIMLSPNALRILDKLGVYVSIKTQGFSFQTLAYKNDSDVNSTVGTYYFGHERMYGYKALRIYRNVLIAALRQEVEDRGMIIDYERKYSHIVSEDDNGVRFAFEDGAELDADYLVGADGIHSKVRQYFEPTVVPEYSGFLGVSYAFPASKLRIPSSSSAEDWRQPVTVMGRYGAFVMAPQNADGSEYFAGRQFRYTEQDRSGWDALLKGRTELIQMLQSNIGEWSDVVQSGLEQAGAPDSHSLNIWPFHVIPQLSKWWSTKTRVLIIGDAAHAIPPTAGQGANQAFEDAYSLAMLLALSPQGSCQEQVLEKWHSYRLDRINKVMKLNNDMNVFRLPESERVALLASAPAGAKNLSVGSAGDLDWLYGNDVEAEMQAILYKQC